MFMVLLCLGDPPICSMLKPWWDYLANTLPVRVTIDPDCRVDRWLRDIQAKSAEIRQYEYSPLYEVQDWSEIPASDSLFDSILVFENYPIDKSLKNQKLSIQLEEFRAIEQTNYPLTIVSGPSETFPIKISFDRKLYTSENISQILNHLKKLINSFIEHPDSELSKLAMLDDDEYTKLIEIPNRTNQKFPFEGTIHQLFEHQVDATPSKIALITDLETVSYQDLNQKANQLAHFLMRNGIGPEITVGISLERSINMVIALLGVLKAGGAYVPLDPGYPAERLAFMFQDLGISLLITESKLGTSLLFQGNCIFIDEAWEDITQENNQNPNSEVNPRNLAYIIYTSGSTGQPKGVMIEHRNLVNLTQAQVQTYDLTSQDRILQFISLSFDAAGEEIYPALCSGAALAIPKQDIDLSARSVWKFCSENDVSVLHFPAALWHQLVQETVEHEIKLPNRVRLTVVGGETPSLERLTGWVKAIQFSDITHQNIFINSYGPTETTITASYYKLNLTDIEILKNNRIPIGQPLSNTKIYLLDKNFFPVPLGAAGEIYIGGAGVARGYLNQPETTQESFVEDPFYPGMRLYKSGDLARRLKDGNLEFIGRVDNQVKLRGYRIELGEIESVLLSYPAIKSAAVILHPLTNSFQLVAYLVPNPASKLNFAEIKDFMQSRLPDYMVPAGFVIIDELPKTPSGKIDRKALPMPDMDKLAPVKDATTPIEELLVNIWEYVLGRSNIGINDDFFDLGGHSLLATQLLSRVRETFQVEIPLRDLFTEPTIYSLGKMIEAVKLGDDGLVAPPIVPIKREQLLPLSFAQQRLWFLDQLSPGNLFYNIPVVLRIKGDFNSAAFAASLNSLVKRHEILRTTFTTKSGNPIQLISPDYELDLPLVDLAFEDDLSREEKAFLLAKEEANIPFDLVKGPLLRAKIVRITENDFLALITMHHIVSDGWSMNLMIREIMTSYQFYTDPNIGDKTQPELDELPVQYADFAVWQRNWLQNEVLDKQLNFWKKQLAGMPKILELPTDFPRPVIQSSNGGNVSFSLSTETLIGLNKISHETGATLFMTMLAAFKILLSRYSGQTDILVGTPIANRNHIEIEGLIGFFVNTLVMRNNIEDGQTFKEFIKQVRNTALDAYSHQDLPFEVLVESLQPDRNLKSHANFSGCIHFANCIDRCH